MSSLEVPAAGGSGLPRSLFTAEEAAAAPSVSETLVRQLTLTGELPCRRIGRLVRYAQADIDAFVTQCDQRGYVRRARCCQPLRAHSQQWKGVRVMGRIRGQEGSVRRVPGNSGMWQARLPMRLDPHRRPLPGTFRTERDARKALNEAIVDMDRDAGLWPVGRPTGRMRRVRDVLADYIDAREHSALAPISIRTVRDYRGVMVNHVCRARADIGRMPVHRLTGRHIRQWMDDLSADGVGAGTIANSRRALAAALA